MQRWEYKVLRGRISEQQLNDLGGEGWELVAVVVTEFEGNLHGEFGKFELEEETRYAYLKRPISD